VSRWRDIASICSTTSCSYVSHRSCPTGLSTWFPRSSMFHFPRSSSERSLVSLGTDVGLQYRYASIPNTGILA